MNEEHIYRVSEMATADNEMLNLRITTHEQRTTTVNISKFAIYSCPDLRQIVRVFAPKYYESITQGESKR